MTTTKTMRPMTQAEFIDAARKLLKPNPVTLGEPQWLHEILAFKYGDTPLYEILQRYNCAWSKDHAGTSKGSYGCCPDDCYVLEPYGTCGKELIGLEKFCADNNLSIHVDSNSYHFPGKTIRIIMHPQA